MNDAGLGFGLLGLSGRYGPRSMAQVDSILAVAVEKFDFIDSATVYGDAFKINRILGKHLSKNSGCQLVNKYGADLPRPGALDLLKREFFDDIEIFKQHPPDVVLLHRPSIENIERDRKFSDLVVGALPSAKFGITTNSVGVLKAYTEEMEVEVLQLALNFCDYSRNTGLLNFARSNNIAVQARSVLASGLLSGTYNVNDLRPFSDPLRFRFTQNARNTEITKERISTVDRLRKWFFAAREVNVCQTFSFAQFVYALFAYVEGVDQLIVGGSSLSQVIENAAVKTLVNSEFAAKVLTDDFFEQCSAPYI